MSAAPKRVEFDDDLNINLWPVDKAVENIDLIENSEVEAIEDFLELTLLRERLFSPINSVETLRPPNSIPTGLDVFDDFLYWGGVPKGEISLLTGGINAGVLQIWTNLTQNLKNQNKKAAWVNSDNVGSVELPADSEIFKVNVPMEVSELMGTLEELIICSQFELIGCYSSSNLLRGPQLERLKYLAKQYQVALVFICPTKTRSLYPHFSLIIDCAWDFMTVRKASHRLTPFSIHREMMRLQ